MEYSRYQPHKKLFVMGIICLLASISLLLFSVYILPYLIWGLHYEMPGFIVDGVEYFRYVHKYSVAASSVILFMLFFIPGLIMGFIAYKIANLIDDELYGFKQPEEHQLMTPEIKQSIKESVGFGVRILMAIVVVLILFIFAEWLIYIP